MKYVYFVCKKTLLCFLWLKCYLHPHHQFCPAIEFCRSIAPLHHFTVTLNLLQMRSSNSIEELFLNGDTFYHFLVEAFIEMKIQNWRWKMHWFWVLIISSVRSSISHTDLLLIHHHPPTHFFRSHRSSTLDFHFLSHYRYIEAIMLYKGKTWPDSGTIWNTLAYSGIL